jgi:hypothetical protein
MLARIYGSPDDEFHRGQCVEEKVDEVRDMN